MPKQFTRLSGDLSLLQETILRVEEITCAAPLLVTTEDYRFIASEQLERIGSKAHRIVIEPESRNTGPAVSAAAELIHGEDPSALVLICPADHVISDAFSLAEAVANAIPNARKGEIVTFGVRPDRPETGYGYVELSKGAGPDGVPQPFVQFIEKPDTQSAAEMLAAGRYVWNAGIFLASVKTLRRAFQRHAPDIRSAVTHAVANAQPDLNFLRLGESYLNAPDLSIDYAVMEHETGTVVPLSAGWTDLGSWRAVWQISRHDSDGVALRGSSTAIDCRETLLESTDAGIEVVGIGLRRIAAIATPDAVLIADLDSTQSVSDAVQQLKLRKVPQAERFRKEFRPWGHYETLALGQRFQVKSIVVRPGGQLSLQSHVHRAEHWVVVEGTAKVTIGKKEMLVSENQSVYIPLAEVHRLSNPGKVDLHLIEVQTGAYLMEDDIIRYEDVYDRV
jgi:mannose-1-phosphate guanylyltransferase/mannose-1-phosphate guanylyltransferase/mannose-6-phosphate isomerase